MKLRIDSLQQLGRALMLPIAVLPIAGLLKDLKQRGMLDETLVVWGTEFGRSPGAQGDGRDHHIKGFSLWMAGGGIKGGQVVGVVIHVMAIGALSGAAVPAPVVGDAAIAV